MASLLPRQIARFLAGQLAQPSGPLGWLLAPLWNRRHRDLKGAAFESLCLVPGKSVLEVGFGGGYLLGKFLAVRAGCITR